MLQEYDLEERAPAPSRAHGLIVAVVLLIVAITALTLYVLHLKHRAEQMHSRTDSQTVAPPVSGPVQEVAVLVAHDSDGQLHRESLSSPMPSEPTERARQIVRVLLEYYERTDSPHPVTKGADVSSVFLAGNDLAVIDCNAAFAETHRSGILVEELTIASIAETLAANMPTIKRVKFLVDGKERETLAGHADLRTTYDVAALNAFVAAGQFAGGAAPAKDPTQ